MRIGVTSPSFCKNEILKRELEFYFDDVKYNDPGKRLSGDALVGFCMDCDALIVGLEVFNSEILFRLPKLRFISKFGVGLDGINVDRCMEFGVEIGWQGGVNKRSVSELALTFMLGLSRNVFLTSNELKRGVWNKNGGVQLTGKKVGIIGYGNVGQDLASIIQPMGCKVIATDIAERSDAALKYGVDIVSLEVLYEESDFITVHTPLNETTSYLINESSFSKMKSNVYVVNTARGGIINEAHLYQALVSGRIAGAATDVFEMEPEWNFRLVSLDNFIATPHIGGNSKEAILAMGRSAIKHLVDRYAS